MSDRQTVLILDFGSQYCQLIARRVRESGVFCQIVSHDISATKLREIGPKAMIFSGGPASVFADDAPDIDPEILALGIPILGICYGMQLIALKLDGKVERGTGGEYGPAVLEIDRREGLFADLPASLDVWMSHGDKVIVPPDGFSVGAHTSDCVVGAMGDPARQIYGVQFHPEVVHTPRGEKILSNFLFELAGCGGGWTMANFISESVEKIKQTVGDKKVILGLSGGVDSSVAAALISRAIGDQMYAVFVDNGLLRAGETEQVKKYFTEDYPLNHRIVDAGKEFLDALAGVEDPERKRKIIGETFINIFEATTAEIGEVDFLAQGTLYPDVIESVSAKGGPSATIKTHHNVGGLPEKLGFELIEPLRELFKDEVRRLGTELGLPDRLVHRQPFPGPGLAVRILGPVTEEGLETLRAADTIVQQEMEAWEGYSDVWQSFAVLLPVKSVGVMGDERTYANVIAIRAVKSLDAMTADWVRIPSEVLATMSTRIINEVPSVNRVVYDISSKPPSTIEWE